MARSGILVGLYPEAQVNYIGNKPVMQRIVQ